MRIVRPLVALLALASWCLSFMAAGQVRAPSDIMEVSEVQPGMTGYGLTVFRGTVPERFDVSLLILRLAQQCMPVLDDVNGRGPSLSIDGLSSKKALPIRGHVVWPD